MVRRFLLLTVGMLLLSAQNIAWAQSTDPILVLRPHCKNAPCDLYETETPSTVKTEALAEGDVLHMDLVFVNPNAANVSRVRSWMNYDPEHLEGVELLPNNEAFPQTTPGEADFFPDDGFIKLEISADEGNGVTDTEIVIAEIKLNVINTASPAGTAVNFYNVQPGGHTEVVGTDESDSEVQLLDVIPSTLHVLFGEKEEGEETEQESNEAEPEGEEKETTETEQSENSDAEETAEEPEEEKDPTAPIPDSVFSLLQVQNVRVTTEGSTVYLGWDSLRSESLKAYNIYYGTVSGQYIQRRTVTGNFSSATVRALPVNTTYYFAVRAVNLSDRESAFSREVAIRVGDPDTSTDPLSLDVIETVEVRNPLTGTVSEQQVQSTSFDAKSGTVTSEVDTPTQEVPGATGPSTILMILLGFAAIFGVFFAFSRQTVVVTPPASRHE